MPRYREEVLNVYLAELLSDRGIVSVAESIMTQGRSGSRKLPDVVVEFFGLRVMLEGKVGGFPQAKERALIAARDRIKQGIAQMGVAIVYPPELREVSDVKSALAHCDFEIAVVTESKEIDYSKGGINYLADALKSAFEHLVEEDVVSEAVDVLDAGIDRFSKSIIGKPGVIERLADILDLIEPEDEDDKQKHVVSTAHISGLVLTNAMIFQEILADSDARVLPLHKAESEPDVVGTFSAHWQTVVEDIDYYPIFYVACEVLRNLGSRQDLSAFQALIDAAKTIVRNRSALRHDLMGRVYHRLLADAKYLGTFYTSIPAATILLRLALYSDDWNTDWADLESIESFKLADLACGTGTLLMAGSEGLANNYINATVAADDDVELEALHKVLVESVIHGYDVLASAIHLTASTLAMRAPDVAFDKMNLMSLPLGGPDHRLGSLEFMKGQIGLPGFSDMFGALKGVMTAGERITGGGTEIVEIPAPPELDLCVMNPPFTRSVGGNLLFGSSPEAERRTMQKNLGKLRDKYGLLANLTAGLGSVFVAIGDKYLRCGGRIALVLPKALISGVAWGKTRDLFRQKYQVEVLIASHDPERWNFSESTSLSEVLVIARKVKTENGDGEKEVEPLLKEVPDGKVLILNLWRNPQTAFEALALVQSVRRQSVIGIADGHGTTSLSAGDRKIGEIVEFPWQDIRSRESWMLPCAFAQTDLIRTAYYLEKGIFTVPGDSSKNEVVLTSLEQLGELGSDARDIHDAFSTTETLTAYPAFWGHSSDEVLTLSQEPNKYLEPLDHADKGRTLRKPEDIWSHAGRILLSERLRFNSQRLSAIRVSDRVLSSTWWELSTSPSVTEDLEKALILWLNSTPGLMMLLAHREETEGAWMKFKKTSLKNLPVLDVLSLEPTKAKSLASAFDRICDEPLQPFPDMASDATRARIDRAITESLGLPGLGVLRKLLAQEPVVCSERLR